MGKKKKGLQNKFLGRVLWTLFKYPEDFNNCLRLLVNIDILLGAFYG